MLSLFKFIYVYKHQHALKSEGLETYSSAVRLSKPGLDHVVSVPYGICFHESTYMFDHHLLWNCVLEPGGSSVEPRFIYCIQKDLSLLTRSQSKLDNLLKLKAVCHFFWFSTFFCLKKCNESVMVFSCGILVVFFFFVLWVLGSLIFYSHTAHIHIAGVFSEG